MDIAGFIRSADLFDLLVLLFLGAMFILGFIQGVIRRLLGLGSILLSFLFAAQVRDPLGRFLAQNWTHLPAEYSHMIGFGVVFVAASVAFTVLIQGFYRKTPLLSQTTIVDEVLGGILGVIQGLVIIGAIVVITDSFFDLPFIAKDNDELIWIREFHGALDTSGTAALFRDTLIPGFFALVGGFIPADIRELFPAL